MPGLIISIDFELFWGTRKKLGEEEIHQTLDKLIQLLHLYDIKSTWAVVGKLFENKDSRIQDDDKRRYQFIYEKLINQPNIEIASHTYQHIFPMKCSKLEVLEDFNKMDNLRNTIPMTTIIFPRNQTTPDIIEEIQRRGFTHYRNTLNKWFLKTNKTGNDSKIKRSFIQMMELFPLNRSVEISEQQGLYAISDSRFFRIFQNSFPQNILKKWYLWTLRLELSYSLKRKKFYHIWFHPHNLMKSSDGLKQLEEFFQYFNSKRKENSDLKSYFIKEIPV